MALSATGEGCHKEMAAILDELVNGILVFLKDSVSIQSHWKNLLWNVWDILASTCSLCRL